MAGRVAATFFSCKNFMCCGRREAQGTAIKREALRPACGSEQGQGRRASRAARRACSAVQLYWRTGATHEHLRCIRLFPSAQRSGYSVVIIVGALDTEAAAAAAQDVEAAAALDTEAAAARDAGVGAVVSWDAEAVAAAVWDAKAAEAWDTEPASLPAARRWRRERECAEIRDGAGAGGRRRSHAAAAAAATSSAAASFATASCTATASVSSVAAPSASRAAAALCPRREREGGKRRERVYDRWAPPCFKKRKC
uniref:Uncharacterized protein n=1 Tax=Oryza rufipogon TaxID=4529 RepID=A0A0E0PN37_ORYRU